MSIMLLKSLLYLNTLIDAREYKKFTSWLTTIFCVNIDIECYTYVLSPTYSYAILMQRIWSKPGPDLKDKLSWNNWLWLAKTANQSEHSYS